MNNTPLKIEFKTLMNSITIFAGIIKGIDWNYKGKVCYTNMDILCIESTAYRNQRVRKYA